MKITKDVINYWDKTIFHFRSLVSHVIQQANYVCCEYGFMLMHVSHYSHEVVVYSIGFFTPIINKC